MGCLPCILVHAWLSWMQSTHVSWQVTSQVFKLFKTGHKHLMVACRVKQPPPTSITAHAGGVPSSPLGNSSPLHPQHGGGSSHSHSNFLRGAQKDVTGELQHFAALEMQRCKCFTLVAMTLILAGENLVQSCCAVLQVGQRVAGNRSASQGGSLPCISKAISVMCITLKDAEIRLACCHRYHHA